jgi:NADH-quinone oxidoreductase subunit G
VVENDPFWNYPNRRRLEGALEKLESLILLDYLPSRTFQMSDVFLPTKTMFEMDGSFINTEGRLQFANAAHVGGAPIRQVSNSEHPPRIYSNDIPKGDPKPAWQILYDLAKVLGIEPEMSIEPWGIVQEEVPALGSINTEMVRTGSVLVSGSAVAGGQAEFLPDDAPVTEGGFQLLLVDWTFGTEELSSYSHPIRDVEKDPVLTMHSLDAADLALEDNDKVEFSAGDEQIQIRLRTCSEMARGVLILPRHHGLDWQFFDAQAARVRFDQIRKV